MRISLVLLIAFTFFLIGSLECSISELKVVPGEEISIPLTVKNDDDEEATISLSYRFFGGEIEGYFYYQNSRVSSITLNSSESAELTFKFIAPEEEGLYYLSLCGDGCEEVLLRVENPEKALKITPSFSGVVIEAGDVVEIDVNVENILGSPIAVGLSCHTPGNWDCRFYDGETEVYRILVETSKSLKVKVDTDSSTEVGKYLVRLNFNEQREEIEFFVEKSHSGEKGEVRLRVVDRDGEGVASATIVVGNETFYTSGDGEAIFEVEPGTYDIRIEKGGYFEKTIRGVKVKGGRTNDIGTVFLEKKAYYAEIALSSPRITATIGDVARVNVRVENRGYGEDSYSLSVEGLPEGFKYNFKSENLAVSEVTLDGGESKEMSLEIYIPPFADVGEYSVRIVAKGKYEATRELKISVVGEISAQFSLEGGIYSITATQGEELVVKGYVYNSGKGTTLTNLKVNLNLPEGWKGSVEPEIIPSLPPGGKEDVTLKIIIPGDAKPSEYRITVEAESDQTSFSDRISVIVKESGFATFVGLGLIATAILALLILIKKVGRR